MEHTDVEQTRTGFIPRTLFCGCIGALLLLAFQTVSGSTPGGNVPPVLTHIAPFLAANGEAAVLVKNNNYSFDDLKNRSDLFDANDDVLSFRIASVDSGTLKLNGAPVIPGVSTITSDDVVTWVPDGAAMSVRAFTLDAFDGSSYSSAPVPVTFDVTWNILQPNMPPTIFAGDLLRSTKNTPLTISYRNLMNSTLAADADTDPIFFLITNVKAGRLTKNGEAVVAGSTMVGPHETLVWIPPANSLDTIVEAFSVKAWDLQDYSENQVTVDIAVGGNHPPVFTGLDPFLRKNFEGVHVNETNHYTFNQLYSRADLLDIDDDAVSFRIVSVNSGQLFVNGAAAVAGFSTIASGDSIDWVPAIVGTKLTGFVLDATDGKEFSTNTVPVIFDVYDATPTFVKGADITFARGNPQRCFGVIAGWAKNIQPYDSALNFILSNDNPDLFISPPEITADGTLLYGVDPEAFGTANVSVVLQDDQGRQSSPVTFKITVQFVNFAPNVSTLSAITTKQDAGSVSVTDFIKSVDAGSSWENDQTVSYSIFTTNASLYTIKPSVDSTGTLSFKTAPNAFGTDNLKLTVKDNGGTANGGKNSTTVPFTINVLCVTNHPPNFTVNSRVVGDYVAAKITVPNAVTLIDKGGPDEWNQIVTYIATASAPQLFKVKPTISTNGTLTYQLLDNIADGTEIAVAVTAKDSGKTDNTSNPQTITIVAPANPFPAAKGVYNGLFYDANSVQTNSAGSYTATLTDKGAYSGKISVEGSTHSFSGRFSTDGNSRITVNRPGKSAVNIDISLSSDQMTGTINNADWNARIAADKAIYSLTNPTAHAGKYTVVIPRGDEGPTGHSFATVNITADGRVATVANLADGTTVSQSTTLSSRNQWPLFASLYKGNGCLISWATLTNSENASVSGDVNWIKGESNNVPAFSSESTLDGSTFTPATTGKRLLNTTNLVVMVDTTDSGTLQIPATLTSSNTLLVQGTTPARLTLNGTSGLISGTVHNNATGADVFVKAIVLQQQNKLGGYCVGPNSSGAVYNQ